MADPKPNPARILLFSIFPGAGHVALGLPQRGLVFLFFMVVLGWIGLRLIPSQYSFFAHHAGAIFVYGLSIQDAYRIAKIRFHSQ